MRIIEDWINRVLDHHKSDFSIDKLTIWSIELSLDWWEFSFVFSAWNDYSDFFFWGRLQCFLIEIQVESLVGRESTTSNVTVPNWLQQYRPYGAKPIRRPAYGQPITGDLWRQRLSPLYQRGSLHSSANSHSRKRASSLGKVLSLIESTFNTTI